MERFKSIYLFTTENIAGYMKDLDLNNKKIITVCASGDHVLNAIVKGCKDITTFDINPYTKYYLDLKISAIKELSYECFLDMFLYDSKSSFDYNIISKLDMPSESKNFWLDKLKEYNNKGLNLKNSKIFNTKYFNPISKIKQNLYLNKENYNIIKNKIDDVSVKFIQIDLKDLYFENHFDYMFLSNISDYLNLMYKDNYLESYKNKIIELHKKVSNIYFAYLYDIGNNNPRSDIDNIDKVKEVFYNIEIKTFETALEGKQNKRKKDGVLVLKEEI